MKPQLPPDSGRIRCVCEDEEDDGFTIQCEQCLVWQHAKCVGIGKTSVPEQYFCEQCNPAWHGDLHTLVLSTLSLPNTHNRDADTVVTGVTGVRETASATPGASASLTQSSARTVTSHGAASVGGVANGRPAGKSVSGIRSVSVPTGMPAMNEISENIVAVDARAIVNRFLASVRRSPPQQQTSHAPSAPHPNFEFQTTVLMDSMHEFRMLQRGIEVREIRTRGHQKKGLSTKYGLFATEAIDPGQLICEFIGHVQLKSLITVKNAKELPVTVTQSFVLFPLATLELAVDARKFGCSVRYARRSCRPTVQVKPVVVYGDEKDGAVLCWGLFARNVIRSGSEILLPLDYATGNGSFRYECACNAPDFCLSPVTAADLRGASGAATTSGDMLRPASPHAGGVSTEAAELEALGIRRSSSAVDIPFPAPTPIAGNPPATRPILDVRKLSREERKLQRYIEYFDRMDSVDAARRASTVSGTDRTLARKGSASSGPSSPGGKQTSSGTSRVSSPGGKDKDMIAGRHVGLKKSWKHLFATPEEAPVVAVMPSEPKRAKRGRKKGKGAEDGDLAVSATAGSSASALNDVTDPPMPPASLPLDTTLRKNLLKRKKTASPDLDIVDEDGDEIDVGEADAGAGAMEEILSADVALLGDVTLPTDASTLVSMKKTPVARKRVKARDATAEMNGDRKQVKKPTGDAKHKTVLDRTTATVREKQQPVSPSETIARPEPKKVFSSSFSSPTSDFVDIERPGSGGQRSSGESPSAAQTSRPTSVNAESGLTASASASASVSASASAPTSVPPDTPSKKRLSLSDYLKKKKASPAVVAPLSFADLAENDTSSPASVSGESDVHVDSGGSRDSLLAAPVLPFLVSEEASRPQPRSDHRQLILGDSSDKREREGLPIQRIDRERERERERSHWRDHESATHARPPPSLHGRDRDVDRHARERDRRGGTSSSGPVIHGGPGDWDRRRDLRDGAIPRDRDIVPRERDGVVPRDRDGVVPRDRDVVVPRDRDIVPRDRDNIHRDMGHPLRDRDIVPRDRDMGHSPSHAFPTSHPGRDYRQFVDPHRPPDDYRPPIDHRAPDYRALDHRPAGDYREARGGRELHHGHSQMHRERAFDHSWRDSSHPLQSRPPPPHHRHSSHPQSHPQSHPYSHPQSHPYSHPPSHLHHRSHPPPQHPPPLHSSHQHLDYRTHSRSPSPSLPAVHESIPGRVGPSQNSHVHRYNANNSGGGGNSHPSK